MADSKTPAIDTQTDADLLAELRAEREAMRAEREALKSEREALAREREQASAPKVRAYTVEGVTWEAPGYVKPGVHERFATQTWKLRVELKRTDTGKVENVVEFPEYWAAIADAHERITSVLAEGHA